MSDQFFGCSPHRPDAPGAPMRTLKRVRRANHMIQLALKALKALKDPPLHPPLPRDTGRTRRMFLVGSRVVPEGSRTRTIGMTVDHLRR